MASDLNELKKIAAYRAVLEVKDGMLVGLGSGSTAEHAVIRLGERMKQDGLSIKGLATSKASESQARELGIPLVDFDAHAKPDIAIDGADEIDPSFNMIKGGGGALLREKIVAQHAKRVIIVADPSKQVKRLGESFPLPIEVLPLAWELIAEDLKALGSEPTLRRNGDQPFVTDNGNYILDAKFRGIGDPATLDTQLSILGGIVTTGLFVGLKPEIIIGKPSGPELVK